MKLLTQVKGFDKTIKLAKDLKGTFSEPVFFHCYWNGNLNEKHLYSIISCYYFNVKNNNNKIILWLENNKPNDINEEIGKYCIIKDFSIKNETKNIWLKDKKIKFIGGSAGGLSEKANFYRLVLLYNYGGCWFDLDCFFLRSFDPIFTNYRNEICLYQWQRENYPNNAIFISLEPKSSRMKDIIDFIINNDKGWGFARAGLNFKKPLDILILPCSWFDSDWVKPKCNINFRNFFKKSEIKYNFQNFHNGAFCYHWHNNWKVSVEENSICIQLLNIIKSSI